jgi:xylose dehydrogenase (NAD/NADP)
MTDQPLRWGFLSTANINQALIDPLRMSKRNTLAAVASRNQDNADAYAHENKIPKAYGSYEALLADPEIDVIYNPLPNHLHAEWTIKAVEAGKHVLVEKPIALTVAEVKAIEAAATKHERIVAEAFMYRHHPQTLKITEIVNSGKLGTIKFVRGSFSFVHDRENNYRSDPAQGGGALWDIGCYPLSYARILLGAEPLEVFGWQVTGSTGIDETFVAQLRFPDEVYAQFDCSFLIPYRNTLEIIGTERRLSIPVAFKPSKKENIYLSKPKGTTKTITIKSESLYQGEVEDMADAVLLGKPPRVSLADSRGNVAAIVALFKSARTGKPVMIK